jgi:hypothetical protein
MNLINIDARHMLVIEKNVRFKASMKKFGITVGLLAVGTVLCSLAAQHFCALHQVCM